MLEIVIPVRGAAAQIGRCLDSVHEDLGPDTKLTIVLDGAQPAAVLEVVERWRSAHPKPQHHRLLRLAERRGFAAAVNAALEVRQPGSHVLLLNSDTVANAGFTEKLLKAAASTDKVATVTPLTNNGTIASIPVWLQENLLPTGFDPKELDELVARTAAGDYPRLPTAVGFCMLITSDALEHVPTLDTRYGLGYGEEVDFCLRLSELGFVHLLDHRCFVFHEGGASFGPEERRLRRSASRRLRLRHPGFRAQLGEFIRADPNRGVRERILTALRQAEAQRTPRSGGAAPNRTARHRILHIVHGWPPEAHGGTEHYAHSLAIQQARRHDVCVFARSAPATRPTGSIRQLFDRGAKVTLFANHFDQRSPIRRNALYEPRADSSLRGLIADERPSLIHIHHLAGHGLSLLPTAIESRVPVVVQLQDWWFACRRANLWHRDQRLCDGPREESCATCLPYTRIPPASAWGRLAEAVRRRWVRRWVPKADALVCGSHYIARSLRRHLDLEISPRVIPYGLLQTASRLRAAHPEERRADTNLPLHFGLIASSLPHKGIHLALEAVQDIPGDRIRLSVWGTPAQDPDYRRTLERLAQRGPVTFRGPFHERDKFDLLKNLDALIVPSVGLESFGIVVREAQAVGTPVLLSDRGALPESRPKGSRLLFEPTPQSLRALLQSLADEPDRLSRERALLPDPKSIEEHSAEMEELYEQVLAKRIGNERR